MLSRKGPTHMCLVPFPKVTPLLGTKECRVESKISHKETWKQKNGGCLILPLEAGASFIVSALCLDVDMSYSFWVGSVEFFLHSTKICICRVRLLGWAFLTWCFFKCIFGFTFNSGGEGDSWLFSTLQHLGDFFPLAL